MELTIIISVVIGFIIISSVVKSNRRKRERELISSVTSREVVNKLKELVLLGENVDYQKQHIENIKDMVGKDRILK